MSKNPIKLSATLLGMALVALPVGGINLVHT